jgi:hypothetical protein
MKSVLAGLIVSAGLFVIGPAAHASSLFNLTCSAPGSCANAPFGTVMLTQNGSNVDVSISLLNGSQFVTTGTHHAFTFNITGSPAILVTSLTSGYAYVPGADNNPGFNATFGYLIDCTGCGPGGSDPVGSSMSFTVGKSGGGTLLVSDFSQTADGTSFSADILNGQTGLTGVVGSNGDPRGTIPEPTSAVLMLSGLNGLLWLKRKYVIA